MIGARAALRLARAFHSACPDEGEQGGKFTADPAREIHDSAVGRNAVAVLVANPIAQ
jgi:hypothetical protein